MNYRAECWFPTMLHIVETELDEKIKPYCLKKRKDNPEGLRFTNEKGYQSQHMYGEEKETVIRPVLSKILKESVCNILDAELTLMIYWININGKGAYNKRHNHPGSAFSGVYYVECPKNCGQIIFHNPHGFTAFDELSAYKQDIIQNGYQHQAIGIDPKAGTLILFPAYLMHGVQENESDEERISISFNCHVTPYH